MKFKAKMLSPLEKVMYDDVFENFEAYPVSSALLNEKHNLVVAYSDTEFANCRYCISTCHVRLRSEIKDHVKIFAIEHIPAVFSAPIYEEPDNYIRQYPGLFPDLLVPISETTDIPVLWKVLNSLWIEIDTASVKPGEYKIDLDFVDDKDNLLDSCCHTLKVINAVLPKQKLAVTHWIHTDCIADYYNIKVFSEKYWKAVENLIKVYVEAGNNMVYTPLFTPPLDTVVGGERTTVQLVDVTVTEDGYEFDFSKLHRWVDICRRCGAEYFEMNHLFTQWGAFHAPKIIASVNGKKKRIFGWETDSHGKEYEAFLSAFLPHLMNELEVLGISGCTYFHISDEPNLDHLESYKACSEIIRKYLKGYKIMDAMANVEFYDNGLVDVPIPYIANAKVFLDRNPDERFVYYCGTDTACMGQGLAMPSSRTRISGPLFYFYGIDGFLHWGYNFYNSRFSLKKIDPYFVSDAGKRFCAGDSYLVYPAENYESYKSVRLAVFRDGLQDMRALELCEDLCGKEAVMQAIIETNGGISPDLMKTPDDPHFTIKLRERINNMIESKL